MNGCTKMFIKLVNNLCIRKVTELEMLATPKKITMEWIMKVGACAGLGAAHDSSTQRTMFLWK